MFLAKLRTESHLLTKFIAYSNNRENNAFNKSYHQILLLMIRTTNKQNMYKKALRKILQPNKMFTDAQKLRESDEELRSESKLNFLLQHQETSTQTKDEFIRNLNDKTKLNSSHSYRFVPLMMGENGRSHVVSDESKRLIEEEVTLVDLENLTNFFYEQAFLDKTLDQFIRAHGDPHAARFAKWIHQKLSGSTLWDQDRAQRSREPVKLAEGMRHVVHDRSSAHAAAWYSPKRPSSDVGRHFQLDECRVWMRLHFWALRESGLMEKSPSFADYYVRFIAHFVRVYESIAPKFARDSLRWSSDPQNIEAYIKNGRQMVDVLGITIEQARAQIPSEEANDYEYPYQEVPQ